MVLTVFDFVIVGLIAISFVISLKRGFVKEVFSLLVWVSAFFVAHRFASMLAEPLSNYIKTPSLQMVAAFSILFIIVLVLGTFANFFISRVIHSTGLTGTDRLLGGVFGIARGIVIVIALIWLGQMTPVKDDLWWKQSAAIPHFKLLIDWIHEQMPLQGGLNKNIRVNNAKETH